MITWPQKDPDEVANYGFIWSTELAEGDSVASSTWILPDGLSKASEGLSDDVTVVKLSGGTIGETYIVTNRIVTSITTETLDQSAKLKIKDR